MVWFGKKSSLLYDSCLTTHVHVCRYQIIVHAVAIWDCILKWEICTECLSGRSNIGCFFYKCAFLNLKTYKKLEFHLKKSVRMLVYSVVS